VAVTLIDLETPARHRPGEAPLLRMGRALAGRRRREFLSVVLAVLALGGLTASATSRPQVTPQLHRVGPALSLTRYAIGTDFLLTAADDGGSVSAYSLDSGEVVWRLEAQQIISMRTVAGVVIVGTAAVISVPQAGKPTTIGAIEVFAVDERTGKRRWSHPGVVAVGSEGAALVVVNDGRNLNAYAPATGELVWRRTFGHFGTAPIADGPPRLLVQEYATLVRGDLFLPRHSLSSVDLATGAVTPVGSLAYYSSALLGLGDPLSVMASESGERVQPIVQGGPAAKPEQVWQLAADPGVFRERAWSCGGLLCTWQGNLTTAVDPASGAQVWQADAGWENHRTMRVDATDLLVTIRRGEQGPNTLLLDPRTGQVRRDLANWSPLVEYHGRQLMLWTPDSRPDPSWLGYVDASAPGGVRPLFPIGSASVCSATARWLYCEIVGSTRKAAALRLDALDRMLA
jgi:hypothetical protein